MVPFGDALDFSYQISYREISDGSIASTGSYSRGPTMSSVSGVTASQQQYFPPSQNQTQPAATSQTSTSQTSTSQTSANQTSASSAAPQTGSAAGGGAKPQPPAGGGGGGGGGAATTVESSATRNADGTFGPKHTLQPPLSYKLLHGSNKVDVKA